jgi:NAD-dependent DNA ligase
MKRAEAQAKLEAAGGTLSKTITKQTDILVAASSLSGAKLAQAKVQRPHLEQTLRIIE